MEYDINSGQVCDLTGWNGIFAIVNSYLFLFEWILYHNINNYYEKLTMKLLVSRRHNKVVVYIFIPLIEVGNILAI